MNRCTVFTIAVVAAAGLSLGSCSNTKSYAELLTEESHSINRFLATQRVELEIPEDGNFEVGEGAPFYKLDDDGNVFMQVIRMGDMNLMAEDDELVLFRFERYSIHSYNPADNTFTDGWGNSNDLLNGYADFRFNNFTLSSSAKWGSGLHLPLNYVSMNGSEVNLVIKSQYGPTDEIAQVTPYYYNVRYFKQGTTEYPEE